jgi:hypothetical protein
MTQPEPGGHRTESYCRAAQVGQQADDIRYIVPWPSAYRAIQLLGANIRFVLSNGGHVASQVNPPTNPKATFRLAPATPPDHRDWLAQAETVQGSWWSNHTSWLADRSGGMKQSPHTLGSTKYPPRIPHQAPKSFSSRRCGPAPGLAAGREPPAASAASACAASHAWSHVRGGACQAPEPCRSGSG